MFWHAYAVAEAAGVRRDGEVAEVAWLRPRAAVARLGYREQADLLADHMGWRPADRPALSRLWSGRWRRERLEQALAMYRVQLARLASQARHRDAAQEIAALLATADDALARGDLNGGWEGFFAAKEREVPTLDATRLEAARAELLEESDRKLSGHWRGSAIRALLGPTPADGAAAASVPPEAVAQAMRLRDEHFANRYRSLEQLRGQLALLATVALVAAAALAVLLATSVVPLDRTGAPDADQVLGVVLFGALGGSFSGALSLLKAGPRTIPDALQAGWTTLMRPVTGAVGALAAFAFLTAGLLGIDGAQAAYAVAFAAGFSERLVSRAAESLG